jgi:hypothetical protein
MNVGGIFCDLAKAFDCINHEILMAKLHSYGIQGTAANWERANLTNIKQNVEIKPSSATPNVFSNCRTVTHGVPQGSVLRSLLFITYINDLPSTVRTLSKSIIFTDDSSVIITNKNFDDFCTLTNTVLSHMSLRFTANELTLSLDKTKIKFVTNSSPQCALSIGHNGKYIGVRK